MTNVASTIWVPKDGNGEFSATTAVNLTDPVATTTNITDPTDSSIIVSPDSLFTSLPTTTWSASDGA